MTKLRIWFWIVAEDLTTNFDYVTEELPNKFHSAWEQLEPNWQEAKETIKDYIRWTKKFAQSVQHWWKYVWRQAHESHSSPNTTKRGWFSSARQTIWTLWWSCLEQMVHSVCMWGIRIDRYHWELERNRKGREREPRGTKIETIYSRMAITTSSYKVVTESVIY